MRQFSVVRILIAACAFASLLFAAPPVFAAKGHGALLVELNGLIGPASVRLVENALQRASQNNNAVVILKIDAPGGLPSSTQRIVDAIVNSPVPVIGYVAPRDARATSAGAFILYATNIAAMAPGTFIGAAAPAQPGSVPGIPAPDSGPTSKGGTTTSEAVTLIRSLAKLRGRNAEWAEKSVRQLATLTEKEALELRVIDVVAPDLTVLLSSVDGRTVRVNNVNVVLSTDGENIHTVEIDFITSVIGAMADPNVALIFMLVGIYFLIYELAVPGVGVSGVFGAIILVLGLYFLNQLPIEPAGLALIFLGIAFMVAEAFTPSFGVLGVGGVIAFVIGGAMLVDSDIPAYQLSWSVILSAAAVSAALLAVLLGYFWRSFRVKVQSGIEGLIGSKAVVVDWSGEEGHVWVHGERWNARGDRAYATGDKLTIRQVDGLTLVVCFQSDE